MTSKENVIELGNFREFKENRLQDKGYEKYLKSLENSQLETEVHALLDTFTEEKSQRDYMNRGQMILKEIRSRAQSPVKRKIDLITDLRLL